VRKELLRSEKSELMIGRVQKSRLRDIPAVAAGIIVGRDDFVLEDVIVENIGFLCRVDDLLLEIFRFQVACLPLRGITIVEKR
jgi:hypothetical protein